MKRVVPPWTYQPRDDKPVVVLGDREYSVDPAKPPVFFFSSYLKERLPRVWVVQQLRTDAGERHPLMVWLDGLDAFLDKFAKRGGEAEYKNLLDAEVRAAVILAYDMYSLDGNRKLQESLVQRLIGEESFQGARHELSVAATMVRARFHIAFEDEQDKTRKHPEFVATHPATGIKIAVEAKSIHRAGVLGFKRGSAPPTMETASAHKIAAQVCGQVERALPKAGELPLYVFVDLNLPPAVVQQLGTEWLDECTKLLPNIDPGYDANGILMGKIMNLLAVTNWPMHLGEERHAGGDTLHGFVNTVEEECRFPDGARHIEEVKSAVKNYGTIPAG